MRTRYSLSWRRRPLLHAVDDEKGCRGLCCNCRRRRLVASSDHEEGNPTDDLHVATNGARVDSSPRALVPLVIVLVPRCRRAAQRARPGGGPHDNLALGTALRSRTGRAGSLIMVCLICPRNRGATASTALVPANKKKDPRYAGICRELVICLAQPTTICWGRVSGRPSSGLRAGVDYRGLEGAKQPAFEQRGHEMHARHHHNRGVSGGRNGGGSSAITAR